MNRRTFLTGAVGIAVGGGIAYAYENDGFSAISDVELPENPLGGGGDSMEQSFGVLSPGFDRVRWHADGSLTIHFGDHDMDGFGIRHPAYNDVEEDIYSCEAPRDHASTTVPFRQLLREARQTYPDRRFKLFAYHGSFSRSCGDFSMSFITETLGSAAFTMPAHLVQTTVFENTTPAKQSPTSTSDSNTSVSI